MSNKENVIQLLEKVPEYKMGYVLAYVQGITADEEADDLFCQRMMENYTNDPDPEKDNDYSLEECKKEWGLINVSDRPQEESQKIARYRFCRFTPIIKTATALYLQGL